MHSNSSRRNFFRTATALPLLGTAALAETKNPIPQKPVVIFWETRKNIAKNTIGNRHDILIPFLGREYLVQLQDSYCQDVRSRYGIWLPEYTATEIASTLLGRPTQPVQLINGTHLADKKTQFATLWVEHYMWLPEPYPFQITLCISKRELSWANQGHAIWTRVLGQPEEV